MKKILRNVSIGIFLLCMLAVAVLIIVALISLVSQGMWYVPVAIVIFVVALAGMVYLTD